MSDWKNKNWWDTNSPKSPVLQFNNNWSKFMAAMKELWDKYQAGELGGIAKSTILAYINKFNEGFETTWFIPHTHILKFSENFESPWFDENTFILEYGEEFEINWFTLNTYINQDTEDFEGVDWDE